MFNLVMMPSMQLREGTITFQLDSGGSLDAEDVLYKPWLKKNFLSVLAMEDMGFSITFQRGKVLKHAEKSSSVSAMVVGVREGTLYRLQGKFV
jgi:hypothetical protein